MGSVNNWITELVEQIPSVISYIVFGYIFVSIFGWVSFQPVAADRKYILVKSVVANFILKAIYDQLAVLLGISVNGLIYVVLFSLITLLAGIVIAMFYFSGTFNKMLLAAGIHRTTHTNIWEDALPEKSWIRIKIDDKVYEGQLKYRQDFSDSPIVVLGRYRVWDSNQDVIYTADKGETIILQTSNFTYISTVPFASKDEADGDSAGDN